MGVGTEISPASGAMLKQEELAFLKTLFYGDILTPLRRTEECYCGEEGVETIASSKAKTSSVALFKRHATITGAGSEPHSSPRKASHPITGKRKAKVSSG